MSLFFDFPVDGEKAEIQQKKTEEIISLIGEELLERARKASPCPEDFALPSYGFSHNGQGCYKFCLGMFPNDPHRCFILADGLCKPADAARIISKKYEEILGPLEKLLLVKNQPWFNLFRTHIGNRQITLTLQSPMGEVSSIEFKDGKIVGQLDFVQDSKVVVFKRTIEDFSSCTYKDDYLTAIYGVSDSANSKAIEKSGVLLDPSSFVDDVRWGESTYAEISKEEAWKKGLPVELFDRFFVYNATFYATD